MNNSNYYESIYKYAQELEARIAYLKKKQESLPRELIKFTKKGDYVQYYLRKPNHRIEYIPTKNKARINALVNAHYIRRTLPKLKKNLKAAKSFLLYHSGIEEKELAESLPLQMQKINSSLFECRAASIEKWLHQEYTRNPYKPEGLIHDTNRGEMMRSKSEVMIANKLYSYELPYLPEPCVYLKTINRDAYPDFLILNPLTMEEIIWEHFGMMGDVEYARAACRKIQIYQDNGYILGKNFIATFESEGAPLTLGQIDHCIKNYLLK